jgi:hypothetical protein
MRIIIELEPGTRVSGISSQSDTSSNAIAAMDSGPPRTSSAGAKLVASAAAAQDVGGPPAALVAQIEAARASADSPKSGASTKKPN